MQSFRRHFILHLCCLCCYKQWSKYSVADKHERTSSTSRLMFWFAVIQVTQCRGIIRYSHPLVNHNAQLNYSWIYILFMTIFSHATWKFAKASLLAETELPKHFIETGLLSSLTQAGKAVGCGVHILQTSVIIYI